MVAAEVVDLHLQAQAEHPEQAEAEEAAVQMGVTEAMAVKELL